VLRRANEPSKHSAADHAGNRTRQQQETRRYIEQVHLDQPAEDAPEYPERCPWEVISENTPLGGADKRATDSATEHVARESVVDGEARGKAQEDSKRNTQAIDEQPPAHSESSHQAPEYEPLRTA